MVYGFGMGIGIFFSNTAVMIKNYFKVTIRNIVRNKLYAAINIIGLSVSLACCLLILLYASEELSFDRHHGGKKFRLVTDLSQKDGETFKIGSSSIPIAPAIEAQIPEVVRTTRVTGAEVFKNKDLISYKGNQFYIEKGLVVDSSFFDMLKFHFVYGTPSSSLPNGNSIVLDAPYALKLFGNVDPIGEVVQLSTAMGKDEFRVTGVYESKHFHSHLTPPYVISNRNNAWNGFLSNFSNMWVGNNLVYTYVELIETADPKIVEEKIHSVFLKNGAEEMKATGLSKVMYLEAIESVHTSSDRTMDVSGSTSMVFIKVLVTIGLVILILACVNYINLSTAQASQRALEVGVRKVMGVSSRGLVVQFLGESFFIVFISAALSVLIAELGLPVFNSLTNIPVSISTDNAAYIALYLGGFILFTGLAAGFYPAFYLASFNPSVVLKGKNKDKGVATNLRKGLVIFQFTISVTLISAIIIISQQIDFIKNKELGFDATTKIVVPLRTEEALKGYKGLKQKFATLAGVKSVSGTTATPGMNILNDLLVYRAGGSMDDAKTAYSVEVDYNYLNTIGIELVHGQGFNATMFTEDDFKKKVIINQTVSDALGFEGEEAIGEVLYFDWRDMNFEYTVVGIAKDIHQFSLKDELAPMMYTLSRQAYFPYILMEVALKDFQSNKEILESEWKTLVPDTPFELEALEDTMIAQYDSDFKTFSLIKYFAFISVVISCLGLYALSLFMAERKFKEIGVRKVMGAEIKDIILLVSKDLSILIIIAFVVSIPISLFAMNKWLNEFEFKIEPGAMTFITAGAISLLIGWLTISYQSFRAARTNPIKVLKDE